MKPFHTVAVPHKDILEGRLTMDVFAANLWETYNKRAPSEYKDSALFFKKTYLTKGLTNLLEVVQKRLEGRGGDPVVQIQTPFGGGKTHALIAMFHRAQQWKAKTVVIVGTALDPKEDTLWGLLEKQLTGSNDTLTGKVSPGMEAIRKVLLRHQPVLILMDEVLEYTTKAAGIPVKETSLAAQTIAFMQELTEVAGTLEKVCLVVTLPSSLMEHYDEKAEKLFQQLQKVSGRVERIYTPVQENEITKIIRRRLFSDVDEEAAKATVSEFLEYAEKEGILPAGKELSEYRDRFTDSFPFIPEVVDVLYHRWGSFPTFQRTRGVLRLLSLVVYSLRKSGRPYLTLSDFALKDTEVRRELIKHIGPEYDSVIAADITDSDSGASKIDDSLGKSFRGFELGTRSAICIFLYSFSGGQEKGAHIGEIKRSATTTENPSSVVAEAVEQLKSKLFYLQSSNEKYYFLNQPNLNRILLTKIENIKDKDAHLVQLETLRQQVSGSRFKVFLWPDKTKDIPDTEELKLVILPEKDEKLMKNMFETKGESPRVYRNTIFFLCQAETEKAAFLNLIKRKMAYEQIQTDKTVKLTEDQRKEVGNSLRREEENLRDGVKRSYRLAFAPAKDGLKEIDLGIPTYGEKKSLDQEVYDNLKAEQEILERLSPLVIKEKYLKERDFVKLQTLFEAMLKTPGERRITSRVGFEESIVQGVKQGMFGLGELNEAGDSPNCRAYREDAQVSWGESEVIIRDSVCVTQLLQSQAGSGTSTGVRPTPVSAGGGMAPTISAGQAVPNTLDHVDLEFFVPRGKVAQIMGIMNLLQSKYQSLRITIQATDGNMSQDDYASKIKETLRQLGIDMSETRLD